MATPLRVPLRFRLHAKTTVMATAEGESSGGEEEFVATPIARGYCGQFVWPCPREYPESAEQRKTRKWLIPADLAKDAFGFMFKNALARHRQGPNIEKRHVFDEPHKRYSKLIGMHERHKHAVFKMKSPFAHLRVQKDLADLGVYGHFSFNLVGYVAYLQYCLQPSAKKLLSDLDLRPWSWPPTPPAALLALCDKQSPQMGARSCGAPGLGRKRKLITFSEITDAFVEADVKTEKDAWMVAKRRKIASDDALYNTLGETR